MATFYSDCQLLRHSISSTAGPLGCPACRVAGTPVHFRSFEKGLADRGGWRKETLQRPEIQDSFLYPGSYTLSGEGGHISGEFFGLFLGVGLSPTSSCQPLFETSDHCPEHFLKSYAACPSFPTASLEAPPSAVARQALEAGHSCRCKQLVVLQRPQATSRPQSCCVRFTTGQKIIPWFNSETTLDINTYITFSNIHAKRLIYCKCGVPSTGQVTKTLSCITVHTKTITNQNLGICYRFRFRNGKANKFPQIFFRICFRNDHVGQAQATAAGHTYEIKSNPRDFLSLSQSQCKERKS